MSIAVSIWDQIQLHVIGQRLFAVPLTSTKDLVWRPMFLVSDLYREIYECAPNTEAGLRYARLQGDLERFVSGGPITDSYLSPIRPLARAVWEIRSRKPKPSLRVFGLFASVNIFIGTNHQSRPWLSDKVEWDRANRIARSEWRKLFEDQAPMQGALHELVPGAIYVR